jgi:tetratricopeptide (TPR) repeat protein
MNWVRVLLSLLVGFTFGFASPVFGQKAERIAPLLEGLGDNHYSISTDSREAQRYFDQGLILAYGFNHAEAERSFREAARLDPDCAMCYWGIALVLGPNINAPMGAESVPKAYEAIQKALELAPKAGKKERAFIEALAKRYAATPVEDRKALDVAYADAMREVKRRFPDDLDGATLFVEALMDLHPWDYWTKEGKPQPWTPEILSNLESVLDPRR